MSSTKQPVQQDKTFKISHLLIDKEHQEALREQFPNITSLSPQSYQRIKDKDSQKSHFSDLVQLHTSLLIPDKQQPHIIISGSSQQFPKIKQSHQPQQTEQSNHLRVINKMAEYEFESFPEKQVQISQNEYEEFRNNYHSMVFDGNNNYLFSKTEPQKNNSQKQILAAKRAISQISPNHAKLKQERKQLKKQITMTLKESKINQISYLQAIQQIKEKTLQNVNGLGQLDMKMKMLDEAIEKVQNKESERIQEVEKILQENFYLKHRIEKWKKSNIELELINEEQRHKNELLTKEVYSISKDFQILKQSTSNIHTFIAQKKILDEKFPNLDVNQIYQIQQNQANLCIELRKTNDELEETILKEKNSSSNAKQQYEQLSDKLVQKDQLREEQLKKDEQTFKETKIEQINCHNYKQDYMKLQNKILNIFLQWHSKLSVYSIEGGNSLEPKAKINDPIQILDLMEREIRISTSTKLQDYLRQIIVSANILQRKYLPKYVNERFDSDKIYERICKFINNLQNENVKLHEQLKQCHLTKKRSSILKKDEIYEESLMKKQSALLPL